MSGVISSGIGVEESASRVSHKRCICSMDNKQQFEPMV
jgi:hypothetical protein